MGQCQNCQQTCENGISLCEKEEVSPEYYELPNIDEYREAKVIGAVLTFASVLQRLREENRDQSCGSGKKVSLTHFRGITNGTYTKL